jgi:hypothetical protein
MSEQRSTLSPFVPRTIAAFERAATQVARRAALPLRALTGRAVSFADRLLTRVAASWAPNSGAGQARPSLHVAPQAMGMAQPWYEVEPSGAEEQALLPGEARSLPLPAEPVNVIAPMAAKPSWAPPSETGERKAAEALGLQHVASAAAAALPSQMAPLPSTARPFVHAQWVDRQLRMAAPAAALAAGRPSYVFVAPRVEPATATLPGSRAVAGSANAPSLPALTSSTAMATAGVPSSVVASAPLSLAMPALPDAPAAAPLRAAPAAAPWSTPAGLPDMRMNPALAQASAVGQQLFAFLERLAGTRAAVDTAPLALSLVTAALPSPVQAADALGASPAVLAQAAQQEPAQPQVGHTRPAPAREWLALPAPTRFRPGSMASRSEQLGFALDARAAAAWGAPAASVLAQAVGRVDSLAAAAPSAFGALQPPAPLPTTSPSTVEGARGPAQLMRFLDGRVGVQTVRALAPLPLLAPIAPAEPSAEAMAPSGRTSGDAAAAPPSKTRRVPEREPLHLAPVGLRAEQWAGVVGVRAANLSIDIVDPARLSAQAHATTPPSASIPAADLTRTQGADAPAASIMPAPHPLWSAPASQAESRLSVEEWALVATFPSVATAIQTATARAAADWRRPDLVTLTPPPASPVIARQPAGATAAAPASSDRPASAVGPRAWAASDPLRLPSGRAPRGSFIWPRVGALSTEGWTPPSTVTAAESAALAAPGMPLWGVMPPLPALVSAAPDAVEGPAAAASAVEQRVARERTSTGATAAARASAGVGAEMRPNQRAAALEFVQAPGGAEEQVRAQPVADRVEPGTGRSAQPLAAAARTLGEAARSAQERSAAATRIGELVSLAPAGERPTSPGQGSARTQAPSLSGAAGRALELARPFLQLVDRGVAADAGRSATPRFFEQSQPLVTAVPASESANRIVEAMRAQPATSSGDDRVSLGDLTLISLASANLQVAATEHQPAPAAAPAPQASAPAAGAAQARAGAASPQEIEELARAAYAELQRLIAIAHERSGRTWES